VSSSPAQAVDPAVVEPDLVDPEQEALETGIEDVRSAWARWNQDVDGVVRVWMGRSVLIGIALLVATWAVSTQVEPSGFNFNFSDDPTAGQALRLFANNMFVLGLHALICVIGYVGLRAMPLVAADYDGWRRTAHRAAGVVAIAFVGIVTVGSFGLQAWTLGHAAPNIAAAYAMPTWELLARMSPHAVPELMAIFLPCGAWLTLVWRRQWPDLLAASVLASAVAVPIIAMAAIVETWIAPRILMW
jgi:hypothetical protein